MGIIATVAFNYCNGENKDEFLEVPVFTDFQSIILN